VEYTSKVVAVHLGPALIIVAIVQAHQIVIQHILVDICITEHQFHVKDILQYEPLFYKSSNTYGGYKRLCISMQKIGCCCVGWSWIRWWGNSTATGLWDNYAWATQGAANRTNTYPYF